MRVLLDANIFISFLLDRMRDSPVRHVVLAALVRRYTLLLPADLLDEFVTRIEQKEYLRQRIHPDELRVVVEILQAIAEEIPRIEREIPPMTRDPKDDYLLAYAIVGAADFLVTGDTDLLVLERVETLQIVTPKTFLELLDEHPHGGSNSI